jgi:hypothetical protein
MRPSAIAGASASGIDADDVLPNHCMLVSVRSAAIPLRSQTASIIRIFALCGANQSISSGRTFALDNNSLMPAETCVTTHS